MSYYQNQNYQNNQYYQTPYQPRRPRYQNNPRNQNYQNFRPSFRPVRPRPPRPHYETPYVIQNPNKRQRTYSSPPAIVSPAPPTETLQKIKAEIIVGHIKSLFPDDQDLKNFQNCLRPPRQLLFSHNDTRTFDKNTADLKTYQIRSVIVVLDQSWFSTTVIDEANDDEILTNDAVQFTQMKTMINELKTCLAQIKTTYKPITTYLFLTGHTLFKAALVFVAKCLNIVTIELDPVNTRALQDYDPEKRVGRIIELSKWVFKLHHKDATETSNQEISPGRTGVVDAI